MRFLWKRRERICEGRGMKRKDERENDRERNDVIETEGGKEREKERKLFHAENE